MNSGIYIITNTVNGKEYVGKDKNLPKRWNSHRYELRNERHGNRHLQRSWKEYGDKVFTYSIIEYCKPEALVDRENWWIETLELRNVSKGYNMKKADGSEMSEETRRRISNAAKGRKATPETRAKLTAARIGHKHSAETIAKMSASAKGHQRSKGQKRTEETRLKIAAALKGKIHTPEHVAKIVAARIANGTYSLTQETKDKISASLKGNQRARKLK
jgi:hypothetical protein